MVMAPIAKVVLGSIAFGAFWILAVFPSVPLLPIGRTAGSLLGAMLMVLFRVITPDQAFKAIDLPILGLLFGTMVVSIYLERADMFVYLGKMLSWKTMGPKDLLCRICLISAISSALFTNDTCCVVLTEFVLKIARQQNLPPHPFLLALATSSNIGSAATPIGNPQNLVIAVQSHISFGSFLFGLLPATLVGVIANTLMLLAMYWSLLSIQHRDVEEAATAEVVAEEDVFSHRFSPATLSHVNSINSPEWNSTLESMTIRRSQSVNIRTNNIERLRNRSISSEGEIHKSSNEAVHPITTNSTSDTISLTPRLRNRSISSEGEIHKSSNEAVHPITTNSTSDTTSLTPRNEEVVSSPINEFVNATMEKLTEEKHSLLVMKWRRRMWKISVYLVTVGMLVSLLMGLNMSWTAITAALALVVLDFKDAIPSLDKVSYMLLIFFCGMFITVEGFKKTGIPSSFWELMEPYSQIDHIGGLAILSIIILILSNVASNVPTVLLLGGRVAASAAAISPSSEKKAWLILAWVSTVAGNLSLLGSASNLIVCEQARRAEDLGYNLTFWTHLKFGIPSTIIVTAIGLTLIRG